MKTFAAAILVAVLAQPGASQQTKVTEQPCTPAALVGTWQLERSGAEVNAASGSTLKHVTPTHFFVVAADATGQASVRPWRTLHVEGRNLHGIDHPWFRRAVRSTPRDERVVHLQHRRRRVAQHRRDRRHDFRRTLEARGTRREEIDERR